MLFPDERLTSYLLNPAVIMCNPTCYYDAHEACILHWMQIACFNASTFLDWSVAFNRDSLLARPAAYCSANGTQVD